MSDEGQGLFAALRRIRRAQEQVADDFMRRQNVVACGIGFKVKGNEQTDNPSLVVSVTRKQPPEMLSEADLIPPTVGDVLTDVVETGVITAYGINRQAPLRPVRPGMSIGHRDGTAGTVGLIVRRGEESYIISNNHVLALLNKGEPGDPILQPGPADGGTDEDIVAELADYTRLRFLDEKPPALPEPAPEPDRPAEKPEPEGCAAAAARLLQSISRVFSSVNEPATAHPVPMDQEVVYENWVDAALARPLRPDLVAPSIVDIGVPTGIATPKLGMRLVKSGRTTGLTEGAVLQIDVMVDVQYEGRKARFVNQIMSTPMSQRGDSGSGVLNYERQVVGLLFSGSDYVTVINPIQSVLASLRVNLILENPR